MYPYPFTPWTWRDPDLWGYYGRSEAVEPDTGRRGLDLVGYNVEALDGKIGSIDEASLETDDSWLVVDTGTWIFGRKVLLPAGTVQNIDHAERTMHVDRAKAVIENSPSYDPDALGTPEYRERVGRYYEDSYRDEPASGT